MKIKSIDDADSAVESAKTYYREYISAALERAGSWPKLEKQTGDYRGTMRRALMSDSIVQLQNLARKIRDAGQ